MPTPCLILALATAVLAAAFDLRTGRIPNALSLGALALAMALRFGLAAIRGGIADGVVALGACALGALAVAAIPALASRSKKMGGGDVKVLAAIGALVGPSLGLEVELLAFIAATGYAPLVLLRGSRLKGATIPFAPAIAIGLVIVAWAHRGSS